MITKIIRLLFLCLVFFLPLIFTSQNSELFELPKIYFFYFITLLILIFHLINHFRRRVPIYYYRPFDLPLLLFYASQIISTYFSIDTHTSIFGYYSRLNGGLLSLTAYLILYFIFSVYQTFLAKPLIATSILSGFFVAGYGILQHFGIDSHLWVQDVQNRVFSTLGQPNWLAAYLCVLLPLVIYRLIQSTSRLQVAVYSLLITIFYLCLLFTKSKSGLAAAAISLAAYFIIILIKKSAHRFLLITIYGLLIAFSLLISNPIKDFFFPPKIENSKLKIENLNITPSEDIRKIVWQGSLDLWRRFPLFGTGPETFAYSYYWVRPASHNLTSEWDFLYNKAHNEYLNYLATTGSLGFLSYILIIVTALIFIFRSSGPAKYAVFSSYLSILITNFAGFSVVTISFYFFILPLLAQSPAPPHTARISLFSRIILPPLIVLSLFLLIQTVRFYLADIAYSLAENLDQNRQYQEALADINLSLRFRPREPVYLIKKAEILSKSALISKSADLATKAAETALMAYRLSPFNLNLLKQQAQAYYYLSGIDPHYYLLALDSLIKITDLAPTDAKSFYLLGEFYQNIGQTDSAIEYYQRAVDLKSNYDHAYFALGQIYYRQQLYQQSADNFRQALTYAPGNPDAQNYLNLIATASANLP